MVKQIWFTDWILYFKLDWWRDSKSAGSLTAFWSKSVMEKIIIDYFD